MSFTVGQTIGDYEVIEILGAGGMGTVYKVRHLISDRLEAMKLVLPELIDNSELADRFMREIKMQARLSHPNIASLHNALRLDNQLLMVMEFIEGRTLHSAMRNSPLPIPTAIDLTLQILSALGYAHTQKIIHRDIKPSNIMITPAGNVKLMDFGIARSLDDLRLTRTGAAVGSVHYMSPEQVQDAPVDARSDIYSVGVLLYEMVTGKRPIDGDSSWAVMNGHINMIPRAPSFVNPQLPESLSLAILMALEKSKERRFQNAQAFAGSLQSVRARLLAAPQNFAPVKPTPVLKSMPTAAPTLAATPPRPVTPAAVQFDPDRLDILIRELALSVGPMAKVLVHRAAKKAQTWKQLYDLLASEVPDGPERQRFLSNRPK